MNHNVQLILGTMTFGQQVFDEEATEMVQKYLSAGYNELDTAYVYNDGDCELLLGRILKKFRDENISVSTKVNPRVTGKLDRSAVVSQFSESQIRLVFVAQTNDTRYDEYGVLRPIDSAEQLEAQKIATGSR